MSPSRDVPVRRGQTSPHVFATKTYPRLGVPGNALDRGRGKTCEAGHLQPSKNVTPTKEHIVPWGSTRWGRRSETRADLERDARMALTNRLDHPQARGPARALAEQGDRALHPMVVTELPGHRLGDLGRPAPRRTTRPGRPLGHLAAHPQTARWSPPRAIVSPSPPPIGTFWLVRVEQRACVDGRGQTLWERHETCMARRSGPTQRPIAVARRLMPAGTSHDASHTRSPDVPSDPERRPHPLRHP